MQLAVVVMDMNKKHRVIGQQGKESYQSSADCNKDKEDEDSPATTITTFAEKSPSLSSICHNRLRRSTRDTNVRTF